MSESERLWLFVLALGLLAAAVATPLPQGCGARRAAAQDSSHVTRQELTPELALARLCVNESGIAAYKYNDCRAIHSVISFRQEFVPAYRGLSYVEALHLYTRNAVVERGHRGRPWIVDLWPDGREPQGYCPTCRWEGRGQRWWARTYDLARRIVRGDVPPVCESRPHGWARDDVRPADRSAERLNCGRTLNVFWSIPRYVAIWDT